MEDSKLYGQRGRKNFVAKTVQPFTRKSCSCQGQLVERLKQKPRAASKPSNAKSRNNSTVKSEVDLDDFEPIRVLNVLVKELKDRLKKLLIDDKLTFKIISKIAKLSNNFNESAPSKEIVLKCNVGVQVEQEPEAISHTECLDAAALKEELSGVQKQIATLIENYEEQKQLETNADVLQGTIEKLQLRIAELETDLSSTVVKSIASETRIEELERQLGEMNETITVLNQEKLELRECLARLTFENEKSKILLTSRQHQVDDIMKEIDDTHARLLVTQSNAIEHFVRKRMKNRHRINVNGKES